MPNDDIVSFVSLGLSIVVVVIAYYFRVQIKRLHVQCAHLNFMSAPYDSWSRIPRCLACNKHTLVFGRVVMQKHDHAMCDGTPPSESLDKMVFRCSRCNSLFVEYINVDPSYSPSLW